MNRDEQFEQRLRNPPWRQIPAAWREEILVAADVNRRSPPVRELTFAATLRLWLLELFWPHPKAWAGLAAVWLVILAVNFTTRETATRNFARQVAPPSPEMLMVLRQQQLLLAELVGRPEPRAADRPKTVPPRPHSQGRDEFLNA